MQIWLCMNTFYIIVLCVPCLMSSVHEMDCLEKETVSVSGRSGARPDGNSSKRQCADMRVQSDFDSSFTHSWWLQFLGGDSRTVSAAPVAGSSADEGSTASAGPFSQWTQCDCPTSDTGKLWCPGFCMTPLQSQNCSWELFGTFESFPLMYGLLG